MGATEPTLVAPSSSEPPSPPGRLRPEDPWGRLEIRKTLGSGGFGDVYLAWDADLEREVALKLLRRSATESAGKELSGELLREGRMMARVRHPNVVTVYGAESHDGQAGLWMEHIAGRTLEDLLRGQGPFGAREAAGIGLDLCRALSAVHATGLIHRDVKAANVMREEGGRIVLMDFGVGADRERLTEEPDGSISGTGIYLAPEVLAGGEPSARSDIYALGVLVYHLVTGSYPVEPGGLDQLTERHGKGERRLLRDQRADLPRAFVQVVERALEADPKERFATAGEMERALAQASGLVAAGGERVPAPLSGSPSWTPRRVGLAAAVVVAGLLLLIGVDTILGPSRSAPYSVKASFVRVDAEGRRNPLEPGAAVAVNDLLSLELSASRDLWVYVFNEDERGGAWALFPLPNLEIQNPLPGGGNHLLPGPTADGTFSWRVDTEGGREHLVVMASPERLVEFEREMARISKPELSPGGYRLGGDAQGVLRGIGALAPTPSAGTGSGTPRLSEMARLLASEEERVEGIWLRRIELVHSQP